MDILKIAFTVLEALLALNLLIFVHELGHFLAARWRGLKIDRFAIWFGKPIWKTKIGGVEYALGWIPAGGYVALPQMATMEMIEGRGETKEAKVTTNYGTSVWTTTETIEARPDEVPAEQLPAISPLDKIIVAVAGPMFSFLLALLFAVIVWQVGKPVSAIDDEPILGYVAPDGPAWKAGLRPGDRILEIDGHPVKTFGSLLEDSITWRVITSTGTNIAVKYSRDGTEDLVQITPYKRETKWYERKALRQIRVGPVQRALVDKTITNSPADLAGLKHGDEIVEINGKRILSFGAVEYVEDLMTNDNSSPVTFTVRRGTEEFQREMLAEKPLTPTNLPPIFGIVWLETTNKALIHPGPWQQIEQSAKQIFATIGAVISKKTDIGVQQLGGAVMITRVYVNLFQSEDGWRMVLWFSVVLNVNLAMLNMLPLPVLDGGHIMLSLVEAARRRPVSPRFLNYIQNGFAILLIGFMLFIAFFDTGDWIRSSRGARTQQIIFAPKQ